MKYGFVVLSAFLFFGCSFKEVEVNKVEVAELQDKNATEVESITKEVEISDLTSIPQDISYFTKYVDQNSSTLYEIQKRYEKSYFSMWNISKHREKVNDIKWPFYAYKVGESYGENLQLLDQKFFDDMYENSNFDAFSTVNKKAITIKHSNIRAFPTIKPLLKNPSLAGEGFPFDYLQNSTVYANKPIFVSHYSKDKEWVYIFSSFASGWVKTDEIVFMKEEQTDLWQKAQQISIIKEGVPLYTSDGDFLFKTKIGMMLALIDEDEKEYTALAVSVYKKREPYFIKIKISKEIATKDVLKLNSTNLERIIKEVSNSNYGWGGMYEQRDCSSMLRDMFAPFGIWLPRNSYMQSHIGKKIELDALSDEGKERIIKEKGIPFQTLLYKQGHIVLYIGTYNDEIVVFHNTWGIKTKKDGIEGRIIVGKTVISSLRLGKNQKHYDEEAEILKNLKSMNILTQ